MSKLILFYLFTVIVLMYGIYSIVKGINLWNKRRKSGIVWICCGLVLLLTSTPITYVLFDNRSLVIHGDDVGLSELIGRTHPALTNKLRAVYLAKPLTFEFYLWNKNQAIKNQAITGLYSPVTRQIYIPIELTSDNDKLYHLWWHELGHHIWFYHMTQSQKKEYNLLFSTGKGFATTYGSTNVEEDFAESFFAYVSKREFKVWKQTEGRTRYEFIEKLMTNLTGCGACFIVE